MSMVERVWDAVKQIIEITGTVEDLSEAMLNQQIKIEKLTERVIRLETALEIALSNRPRRLDDRSES